MNDRDNALQAADHCVKCGLCLPHCPTYRLYADEADSPRGRIALAEGLLRGMLAPDATLREHLDRCLLCRACEVHCPSGVRFGRIMDAARNELGPGEAAPSLDRPLARLGLALARHLPLPGRRARLARALPGSGSAPAPGHYAPSGTPRSRLGLLTGCVTGTQQAGALHAAIRLLNALGHEVVIPPAAACCGALAAHHGDPATAVRQTDALHGAFTGLDGVVAIASGCALQLHETLPELGPEDIVTRLARELPDSGLRFAPVNTRVALHVPCTLANGLRRGDDLPRLIDCLPETDWPPLGRPGGCCGAAGMHLLTRHAQAERLRQPLLDQLLRERPALLLTSNIGCALHLAEGARAHGLSIEVLHPVELLARQLEEA
ncbi:(Fe-S)-binding protein [endosymbiont of unidentified scaly snail isolate Monju]|uniref:(Fe-S)-binding protein n=1 Tax=endosymbiont of unidentified scaly snail isolate Monju TaxID=1248727 RepID=UPI0003892CFA|nr:(Fe-S)-binding protein [endosymbiont of unidentified scaly snail isolate Monju]BAN70187.1 hypothetical protein EBS_2345 [endosymbiont of unidentified scaly snail isolate Monju]